MYYGSNRATAIALSTMLLALLLASSFASIPIVHGQGTATVSPSAFPIFCDSTGDLEFTIDTGGETWRGVAIEIPSDFTGLTHGDPSKVSTSITNNYAFISVVDESRYYPYRSYFWVQVHISTGNEAYPGFTGSQWISISGLKAPSVASDYEFYLYYTTANFACTTDTPRDFSDGRRGTQFATLTMKVHMREEGSTIAGYVSDPAFAGTALEQRLNLGYVTATAASGPLKGKVVAQTSIKADGLYKFSGLYEGLYTLTAWGQKTSGDVIERSYYKTSLPANITVGRCTEQVNVNIAVNRGGTISGSVKLYDGTTLTTPSAALSGFTLPAGGLPVRLELIDAAKTIRWADTVYVPAEASTVSYSIKELADPEYSGIPSGTYTLKAYACGFIQTATVSISVAAPGGTTIDIPLLKGGGIIGTIYYYDALGSPITLAVDETILVEALDAATGEVKGVWIGKVTGADTSSTIFNIRGLGDTITPPTLSGHAPYELKTRKGRGLKDSGLADGGYKIKVYVRGFVQPTPEPTAVISYAGTGTVAIYLRAGGKIDVTLYSKDPTGVYVENWRNYDLPDWEYDRLTTAGLPIKTRITMYVYDAADKSLGTASTEQTTTDTASVSFRGYNYGYTSLQTGSKSTALATGAYTVKVYTWGYLQAAVPTTSIVAGGTQAVAITMKRGGVITGMLTFREAGVAIPGGITALLKVEATDAAGVPKGATFVTISTALPSKAYAISGLYKYTSPSGTSYTDAGLADGTCTIKATLVNAKRTDGTTVGFTHATQTATIAGGSSTSVNFDPYSMGKVTGTLRGLVTYRIEPVKLSWAKITLTGPAVYTTYSADGTYTIRVPDGTYTMAISAFGYKPYTVTVSVASGTTQVVSADLVESFEAIPEFPLGAAITLLASFGLALYLLRWIRKPIVAKL